jgi:hypothetical protein
MSQERPGVVAPVGELPEQKVAGGENDLGAPITIEIIKDEWIDEEGAARWGDSPSQYRFEGCWAGRSISVTWLASICRTVGRCGSRSISAGPHVTAISPWRTARRSPMGLINCAAK